MADVVMDVHAVGTGADVGHVGADEAQVRAVVVAARVRARIHQDLVVHVHAYNKQKRK